MELVDLYISSLSYWYNPSRRDNTRLWMFW